MKNSKNKKIEFRNPAWVEWSMTNHTEDEIRDAILNKPELVCYTYLSRYSQMSGEFIENEFIVLSTGLFTGHPEYYNEKNRKFITEILFIESTADRLDILLERCEDADITPDFKAYCKLLHNPIRTKIDWWQIACYQNNLTPEFRNKFRSKFKEAKARVDRPVENMSINDSL